MIPSDKQHAIYSEWRDGDSNILINAVAGSGKTTTLIELIRMCQRRVLYLAFNKSVQEETNAKLQKRGLVQGKAMTMHSLGLKAIRSKKKVKINSGKNYDIINKIQNMHSYMYRTFKWEDKIRLSYTIMDMIDVSRLFLTDDIEQIKVHMIQMDKNFFDKFYLGDSVIELLWNDIIERRDSYYTGTTIEIDFNDMIYLPVKMGWTIPVAAYYLMIDEAQDLNLAQHALIDMMIGPQGTVKRWIAVGDKNQSIYGFSGSFSQSFEMFLLKDDVKQMPLDICYRCAQDIIIQANDVYDVMIPFRTDVGIVDTLSDLEDIKDDSMIICRNSMPLFYVYFQLLQKGRSVMIKGEDIIGPLIKFLKPFQFKAVSVARKDIDRRLINLFKNKEKSDKDGIKYYLYKQQADNFMILSKNMVEPTDTVKILLQKLDSIFKGSDKASIMLCTIHKAKGLEGDIVYILNENLIPSRFAKSPEQLRQEINLKYVARTRAKNELYYLNLPI